MDKSKLIESAQSKQLQASKLLEKGNDITTDDIKAVEALNSEITGISDQIKTLDRAELLKGTLAESAKFLNEPGARLPIQSQVVDHGNGMKTLGYQDAGTSFFDVGTGQFEQSGPGTIAVKQYKAISEDSYKRAFKEYLRKGDRMSSTSYKDISEGLDPQGGYLAPPEMINRIIQRKPTPTRVADFVTNITTSRDSITMPRVNYIGAADDPTASNYTTPFRVTYTGELANSGEAAINDSALFGQQAIPVFTAMLTGALTNDMIEDSMFGIEAWISSKMSETVDLEYDRVTLLGSGVGQGYGILLNPNGPGQIASIPNGVAYAGTVGGDNIFQLAYAIPEQYDENCRFVLNKTKTAGVIATLKDTQGRYLFGQGAADNGFASARPKELAGYPYAYSGFMPGISANAFPIIFGDLSGYYKVNRLGFSLQVLRETRAKQNEIELVGRFRFGGTTVEPWKMRALQIAN